MSKRLEAFEKMIAAGAQDAFVWYARAMELRSLGRLEDAMTAFGEVRDKFPAYVPTYLMASQVATQLGRPDEARRWCQEGIERAGAARDAHALGELEAALAQIA